MRKHTPGKYADYQLICSQGYSLSLLCDLVLVSFNGGKTGLLPDQMSFSKTSLGIPTRRDSLAGVAPYRRFMVDAISMRA